MASTLLQSYKNLPASCAEISALKKLLDGDLEHRSSILRRQEEVQAQSTYSKKVADGFGHHLATTSTVKDAFAASILSTKALREALQNAFNLCKGHCDILATISSTKGMLATISSTKGMLATWDEIMPLTEALLTHLDKATPQIETHLDLVADEHATHEFAYIAASESMLSYTDILHAVDRNIAKKMGALFCIRQVPTEILQSIFIEAVDARQHEIITSLSSYDDQESLEHDLNALLSTLNLVPFTLSATCKRWRAICQSTPRLWKYARVPTVNSTVQGNKIIGKTQFEQCVLLAQKQPLELTVYPCYNVTHQGATYPNLVLRAESQTLKVTIVWHGNRVIPPGIPSPTELCIVASANSPAPYNQVLPTQLLANTKTLRCMGLTPLIDSAVGIQTLHISHSTPSVSLPFRSLFQNCPLLEELHLENASYSTMSDITLFTHRQLHTVSLKGIILPALISAVEAGCRFPRLSRLVLTDINGLSPAWYNWVPRGSRDLLSQFTHIELHALSELSVVHHFRMLFEVSTALRTLTLVGSAVVPMLGSLMQSAPKRVEELRVCNSNANGTTLRDYLAAIKRNGGGTSGMKVVWDNCPNFSGEYGGAFGELHL